MKLATLVTNTDFSAFSLARPMDDQAFADMITDVRPAWEIVAYWVCKDEFPEDIANYDGVMITGSPSSVTENTPWMMRLEALIQDIVAQEVPLFGACFGHQAIAKALGAPIVRNPQGWGHGRIRMQRVATTDWSGPSETFHLNGSHIEQVGALPDGAQRLFESAGCSIAGFAIGRHVFTVQHHPEMTDAFMDDLIDEYADYVGQEATDSARASMQAGPADRAEFAEEIAAFFESGAR